MAEAAIDHDMHVLQVLQVVGTGLVVFVVYTIKPNLLAASISHA
jgi:hypothetical protein